MKKYMKPQMVVVELKSKQMLLAGSGLDALKDEYYSEDEQL